MPDVTNMSGLSKGVADLARDAAYVAVGFGVLGYQRAQVQRAGLKNMLSKEFSLDQHLSGVRAELTKGVEQLDDLLESATQFIETSLQPLEQQLPSTVTQLTSKALGQSREVRSQIRQRVSAS
jgi:flagellar biosynthesis/type III secretory pathway protein FliH